MFGSRGSTLELDSVKTS